MGALLNTVNMGVREGWDPVYEEGSVSPHQEDREPLEEMPDSISFLLPRGSCQGLAELPDLEDSVLMPTTH